MILAIILAVVLIGLLLVLFAAYYKTFYYPIKNVRLHAYTWFTNKIPGGVVRGIGNVEILMDSTASPTMGKVRTFNPDPQRALWLSALCPGLGQIYNRRYWKLPIVVGAFVGLTYGATWNNRMYKDYSKGYRDVMDDDPDTRSYMDFFPPTVKESDLDTAWLQKVMKNKRD